MGKIKREREIGRERWRKRDGKSDMQKERWKSRDGKKWKKRYGDGEIGKER
jgi:hypothetical protein